MSTLPEREIVNQTGRISKPRSKKCLLYHDKEFCTYNSCIDDLAIEKFIGEGRYGQVNEVEYRGKKYALKIIELDVPRATVYKREDFDWEVNRQKAAAELDCAPQVISDFVCRFVDGEVYRLPEYEKYNNTGDSELPPRQLQEKKLEWVNKAKRSIVSNRDYRLKKFGKDFGFIIMEKYDVSLSEYTEQLPYSKASELLNDVNIVKLRRILKEKLRILHKRKIAHGDLHSGNVLLKLDKSGNIEDAVFIDFGNPTSKSFDTGELMEDEVLTITDDRRFAEELLDVEEEEDSSDESSGEDEDIIGSKVSPSSNNSGPTKKRQRHRSPPQPSLSKSYGLLQTRFVSFKLV